MTTTLQTDNLEKRYPRGERPALRGFSLQIAAAEIAAVIGASGSGKTTLLRLLAGLEAPDSGEIWIAGQCVAAPGVWVPPERRGLGFVFQEAALFPHMSVAKNVAYGLRRGSGREARVAECLDLVGLAGFGQRYPAELSGGERQRVALARALAPSPRALLLDEPFSNLDPERRLHLRGEVQKILRAVGITAVIVTHDTEDALAIADRIAILREGHLAQQDRPATFTKTR
ncbi:MAG: ABC transporter ATP-binding protein [Verrucomicrobiales bacterium]